MKPKFGAGLLFDSYSKTADNKVNGIGVINIVRAWGFPCFRQATAIISIFNLKKGTINGKIQLIKSRGIEEQTLTPFTINSNENNACTTIIRTLPLKFNKQGRYFIKAVLPDHKSTLKIPFNVKLLKWPIFSNEERKFVIEHHIPSESIRTEVHCQKCAHVYIFEENILEEMSPPGGVMRFPESGEFKCTECGETIYLRDIQGQIRFSLKQLLSNIMKGH